MTSPSTAAPAAAAPGPAPTWPDLTATLLAGTDLTTDQTAWAMDEMMSGRVAPVPMAGFLVALRAKGESVAELDGLAAAMVRHALPLQVPGECVDVVGTGGDRLHTVNISTMAALVVAGTGERVVKHGNRAASSSSGAADVLEALGVRLDLAPERVAALATEVGITFCFAQVFHPAMRFAGPVRRELGVPTSFNLLGPLTNPARPAAAAIGIGDLRLAPVVAGVLARRGTRALVFRGHDGMDELSTTAPSDVWLVAGGEVQATVLDPRDLGIALVEPGALRGGDPARNAAVVRSVLSGEATPVRDAVLLNAAAALVALQGPGDAAGLVDRFAAALGRAAAAVDDGSALRVLDTWVAATAA